MALTNFIFCHLGMGTWWILNCKLFLVAVTLCNHTTDSSVATIWQIHLILADSWYHNMTESWKQSLHLPPAHTLLKGFIKRITILIKIPIFAFPPKLFISTCHTVSLCFCLHTLLRSKSSQPYLQVTKTAPILHSKPLISLFLPLYTSSFSQVRSFVQVADIRGRPSIQSRRQWKYTRLDNDGWLAVRSLP